MTYRNLLTGVRIDVVEPIPTEGAVSFVSPDGHMNGDQLPELDRWTFERFYEPDDEDAAP